jgi:hypothetical protein
MYNNKLTLDTVAASEIESSFTADTFIIPQ